MKKYKTPLYRMKLETFTKRLASGKLGFRIRAFLAGKLSAVVHDGRIHFTRL